MGEREEVQPVRCRGRDMEELLLSCNERLPKQASRPRRMFNKEGVDITADFDQLDAGKLTEEVWVSMGEPYETRQEMVKRMKQKSKLSSTKKRSAPSPSKTRA
jgi:hypothetical protein